MSSTYSQLHGDEEVAYNGREDSATEASTTEASTGIAFGYVLLKCFIKSLYYAADKDQAAHKKCA